MSDQNNNPEPSCVQPGPLGMEGSQESIGFMLSRVGASVAEQFATAVGEYGLMPRQFFVLNLINEHEGESQQAVAESIGVAKSHMVGVVDELEEKGLLERRVNASDRRQHALFLTDTGRELRDAALSGAQELEARIRSVLTPTAATQLLEALHKVAELDDTPAGVHPALAKKLEMGD